ncbi:MAG: PKD domain-containing protein [Bacteroidota bacterium]|nr:PKD domain-containing protein [Bacteroidota bacterium]
MVFVLDAGAQTPVSYDWDFGDGQKSTLSSPANLYIKAGIYKVKVTSTFTGGASCSDTKTISVYDLPVAKFSINPISQFCFVGNNICVADESTESADKNALKKRIILWGDGAANIDTGSSINNKGLCHSYNQTGQFIIDMEITDTKGCTKKFGVTINIKHDIVAQFFADTVDRNCDSPRICFTDISIAQAGTHVKGRIWKSGNTTDSNATFCKTFYAGKYDTVRLYSYNDSGCVDTAETFIYIPKVSSNYQFRDSIVEHCFGTNEVWVSLPPNSAYIKSVNTTFYNEFHKPLEKVLIYVGENSKWEFYHIAREYGAGVFYISQSINYGFCNTTYTDSIYINGPGLNDKSVKFRNTNQCKEKNDSVFVCVDFIKARAKNAKVTVDYGDNYSPACTSWVGKGINVGQNCNISHDNPSAHLYTKQGCYQLKLTVEDTILHCVDSMIQNVWIGPPKLTPFYYSSTNHCKGSLFTFFKEKMQPSLPCGFKDWWINFDSACDIKNFVHRDTTPLDGNGNPFTRYNYTCGSDGWVTVGFVGKTGGGPIYTGCNSSNGEMDSCIDTIWVHNWFRIFRPKAIMVLLKQNVCANGEIEVGLRDSIQDSIDIVVWDFNDGTIVYDTIKGPKWLIKSQKHIYKSQGHWPITVTVNDKHGCSAYSYQFIDVGHSSFFTVKDTVMCMGSPTRFYDDIWYWSSIGKYTYNDSQYLWKFANRPEKMYWYFGDGDSATGTRPQHTYKQAGKYKPMLVSIDSLGCIDTFYANFGIHILNFHANFYQKNDKFLCGEFVQLFDSSYSSSDSTYTAANDTAIWWDWDFGDGKRHSSLQNPYHNYSSFGWFTVTLKTRNKKGCEDSISKRIYVKGPIPSFEIISDSIGCVAMTVRFRNTSIDTTCSRYIWLMGDSNRTIISTTSDTDIVFTYTKPGRYEIYLYGEDSIYNPDTKNKYYCSSLFPDTNFQMKRVVIVQPFLPADFTKPDTVCPHQYFDLIDKSDSAYTFYRINWDDGTYDSAIAKTIKHAYNKSGIYTIQYMPGNVPQPLYDTCFNQISKTIIVSNIIADFDLDATKIGETGEIGTIQKSTYAVKYKWDFGNAKQGSSNKSTEIAPSHNYAGDTGIFNVCLWTYNEQGCWDSLCKPVHAFLIHHILIPNVFTANGDTINDAFDIDIEGEEDYHLYIYNRWGELVFIGTEDGEGDDGKNWNGHVFNTGAECAEGTYYWVLSCRFRGYKKQEYRKGFLTLLR